MDIAATIEIDTPPEALWPFLIDLDKIKRWNVDLESDEPVTDGPTRLGSRSRVKIRERSRVVEYDSEITAFEPHSFLEVKLSGGSLGAHPMFVGYRLRPVDAGTQLELSSRWRPSGLLLRLLSPLINAISRRNQQATLARLKTVAEG